MAATPESILIVGEPSSAREDFLKGLWQQNPIFVQVLGMCPTLAVTNSVINAIAMGLATCFVLVMSNVLISSLRRFIPHQVRIACYIAIIATFVTTVDYLIQAISLSLHNALGAFVPLIVVNCLILGRAEAFASKNTATRSFLDGLGMGLGFSLALFMLGVVRELLGSGCLFGLSVFNAHFQPWVIMILPSGGFFTLALLILVANWAKRRLAQAQHVGTTS